MYKRLALLGLLSGVIMLAGCPKDPYAASAKVQNAIAASIGPAMTTIDQTRQNGLITSDEEQKILGYFKFANDADQAFGTCLSSAAATSKPGAFTACASAFNTQLNSPAELSLLKVANPQAQADVNVIVQAAITAVNSLATALGGK